MKVQTSTLAALMLLSAAPGALVSANEIKLRGAAAEWDIFEDQDAVEEPTEAIAIEGFEAAKSLDFFRNIDPNKFEWVNKSEIQPGETTCGFLKAPLVWNGDSGFPEDGDTIYPTVDVYVCVKFAKQQPAMRGNLAVHGGGPGTLSNYVYSMGVAKSIGEEAEDSYNIIGFDQRGFGRSLPTHVRPECSVDTYGASELYSNLDLTDDDSIRAVAQVYKKRNIECWKQPDFQLKSDSGKTYHFLEHSGTRQLAEDIERVRRLFGNQKLSVYGVSYGTSVFGTYATMFPNNVHLMVLDGNMNPVSDIVEFSEDQARSSNQRIDYFIAGCEFGDVCGVDDVPKCVKDLNNVITANKNELKDYLLSAYGYKWTTKSMFMKILTLIMTHVDKMPEVCSAASQGDWVKILHLLLQQGNENDVALVKLQYEMDSDSKPTSGQKDIPGSDPNWPFGGYEKLGVGGTAGLILSQDMAFGAYNEDLFVKTVKGWNEKYPGAFTQKPAIMGMAAYVGCYYWPKSTPLPPMGNAVLRGIVSGQVYDYATPYIGTQKLRQNFPNTHLLTSRSFNHGLRDAKDLNDVRCQNHLIHYFTTGEFDFTDGYVCGVRLSHVFVAASYLDKKRQSHFLSFISLFDHPHYLTTLSAPRLQSKSISEACTFDAIMANGRCA